ncbi:MAG: O-antigen ligase family protein [Nitrospirota bacterium]|mgnify:CR=1 FL=1
MGNIPRFILILFVLLLLILGTGLFPFKTTLALLAGIIIFIVSFMSTEITLYFLIFSMLLSPEIIVASTPAREISLRLEDFLLPLLILGWFARIAVYKDVQLFSKTPYNKPIIVYIFLSIFATGLGYISGRVSILSGSLFILKYIEYFMIFFIVANYVKDEEEIKRLGTAILITSFLISVYAIYQIPSGERVTAPFEGRYGGEPNTLGGYLVLMISITLGLALTLKEGLKRLLLVGLLLLQSVSLLYSLSRSSWLGLIPMYGILFVLSERKRDLLFGGIIALLLLVVLSPAVVSERYSSTFQESPGFERTVRIGRLTFDPSASERITGFKDAIKAWKKKPVLGYGVTGKGFIDGQYFRILVEVGLVGLAVFLWLVYTILKNLWLSFSASSDPYLRGLSLGLIAGTAGILVHSIGANSFIIVRIMEPYWLLVGLVFSAYRLNKYKQSISV